MIVGIFGKCKSLRRVDDIDGWMANGKRLVRLDGKDVSNL
jgi:hypothetical protein